MSKDKKQDEVKSSVEVKVAKHTAKEAAPTSHQAKQSGVKVSGPRG